MKKKSAEPIEPVETVEAPEAAETETLPSQESELSLPESVSLPQINQALRLRAKGVSLRSIAEQTGLSESTAGRLLKSISKEASLRLASSLPIESTKSLANLEVGEFVPETFQSDLYQILRNSMRFAAWWNSLPDDLKSLVVKSSHDGQKSSRDEGIISDSDVKKLVLLNFALKPQSGNVTPQSAEAEVQRVLGIFKSLRDLEQGAVQQHKQVEEEVRRSLQPEKSGIEKVGEALRVINKEATPILEKVGQVIHPSAGPPPPPPRTPPPITEEDYEAQQLTKIQGEPPKLSNLLEENHGTFSEGLPEEETAEQSPVESEPIEKGGGSVSEVEKRLKRRVEKE